MKFINKIFSFIFAVTLIFSFSACEEDNSLDNPSENYVSLEASKIVEVADGATVVATGRILASEAKNYDRTFNLLVDASTNHSASYYSVPTSVTIPANSKEGTYQVSITGTNLVDGSKIVVTLQPANGTNMNTNYTETSAYIDGKLVNSVTSVTTAKSSFVLYRPCSSTRVKISITFDNYPEETAWELYDSSFTLLDSGGFGPDGTTITGFAALGYADQSTFSNVKCLTPGTYTFVIYDDFGDGMYTSATISGNYSLSNLNNGVLFASGSGDFGGSSIHEFTVQ